MLKNQSFKAWTFTCSIILCGMFISSIPMEIKAGSEVELPPLPKIPALSKKATSEDSTDTPQSVAKETEPSDSLDFKDSSFSVDELFSEFSEDSQEGSEKAKEDSNKTDKKSENQAEPLSETLLPNLNQDTNISENKAATDEVVENKTATATTAAKTTTAATDEVLSTAAKDKAILSLPDIPSASEIDQSKIDATKLPQQVAKEKKIQDLFQQSSNIKITREDKEKFNKQTQGQASTIDPYSIQSSAMSDKSNSAKEDDNTKNLSSDEQEEVTTPGLERHREALRKKRNISRSTIDKKNKTTEVATSPKDPSKKPLVNESKLVQKNYPSSSGEQARNDIDSKKMTFINNEAQVLLLENDDVVLGKITEAAAMEAMNFDSYIVLFQKKYRSPEDISRHDKLVDFIDQYDQIFYPEEPFFSKSGQRAVFSLAIKAITGKQFNDLKTLLDHYNILQLKDSNYNNLLHGAVITDNYPVARLLLMRGIDMKAINNMGYSAMDLAKGLNNSDMIFLLNSAGFYK